MELFRVALDSAEPPFSLLYLHGPAGIGKTSLLDIFAGLAADVGARVVRLDGRDLLPSPPAVLDALRGVLRVPDGEGAIVGLSGTGRLVVLVPWDIAVGGDLIFPGVQGRRTAKVRLVNTYLARQHAAAVHDASLASAFVQVAGLVTRPESLLHPGIALRVLGASLHPGAGTRGRLEQRDAVRSEH